MSEISLPQARGAGAAAATAAARRPSLAPGWSLLLWQALTLIALIVIWEVVVRAGAVGELYLPRPSRVLERFWQLVGDGQLAHHTGVTLAEFAAGYVLAVVIGVGGGLALVLVPHLERFANPFVAALMAVPKVAIVPLLALWLGIGFTHKIVIVFLFAVFQILYNTVAGVKQTRPEHLKVVRAFGASRAQTVWKVVLPSALPTIFAALKVSAAVGLLGALFAEMLSSKAGLGNLITRSAADLDTPLTFALVIYITLLAVALNALLDLAERSLLRWRQS